MCGRFVRDSSIPEIAREFNTDEPPFDMEPSYNVAPTQNIVIVMNDGQNRLVQCKWGFIPSWAKDEKIGYKMINASGDSVADKPSFRSAFNKHRCLIVANGFYEWRKEGKIKMPFYIFLKSGKPFGFAGLYSVWHSPDGKDICTSTIITTDSNELVAPIHNRMPVIIPKEKRDLWLDPDMHDKDTLTALLSPCDPDEMQSYGVSSMVNSSAHNSPDNIRPLDKDTM